MQEDLEKYPKNIDEDFSLFHWKKSDAIYVLYLHRKVFIPQGATRFLFDLDDIEDTMEGLYRSQHFDGIATVIQR